jgi:hypothetical protein
VVAEPSIPIPIEFRRPHRFVSATRQAASGKRALEDGRLSVGGTEGVIRLTVTRDQLGRALLVAQAIFKEAERRGYLVESVKRDSYERHAGVAVVIRGHAYAIEIGELQDKVPLSPEELSDWDRHEGKKHYYDWQKRPVRPTYKKAPNGYLRVSLPSRWSGARSNFSEGPRGSMDRRLPTLFEELERRAQEDDRRAEERARRDKERRCQEATRAEREWLRRIEVARVERLKNGIASWRLSQETREYVTALRARLPGLDEADRSRISAWCDWAEEWSERSDPVREVGAIRGLDDEHDQFHVVR